MLSLCLAYDGISDQQNMLRSSIMYKECWKHIFQVHIFKLINGSHMHIIVEATVTVEENFGGQLDTQHAQIFQLCLCSSNRYYVH